MKTIKVHGSTLIQSFRYHPKQKILHIRFDDATIDFYGVPLDIYHGLLASKDRSQFYLNQIYGKYDYEKQ
jgi:KTSC domain